MNMTLRVIIDILLVLGAFFTFVGVVGVIRMPDVFGRLPGFHLHRQPG